MKRIVILGNSGSGKSTLTNKLANIYGYPYLHLDTIVYKHDWKEEEYLKVVNQIESFIKQDSWICDGNFLKKATSRFEVNDSFIFLDFNRFTCFFRVIFRYFKYKNKPRESRCSLCNEKLPKDYLKWVFSGFYNTSRLTILKMLSNTNKEVVILKNKRQVKKYLKKCYNEKAGDNK